MSSKIREEIRNNVEAIKEIAPVIREQSITMDKNEKVLAETTINAQIERKCKDHFIDLHVYEFEDKPALIIITGKNIPTFVNCAYVKQSNGKGKIVVNGSLTENNEMSENCTDEQRKANVLIRGLSKKYEDAIRPHLNTILEICPDWATAYACAKTMDRKRRMENYQKMSNKFGKD